MPFMKRKPAQGSTKKRFRKSKIRRKKVCRLCADKVQLLDYKDTESLLKFLTEKGKIVPRRITGNCTAHQRALARTIKRSRHAALIAFSAA